MANPTGKNASITFNSVTLDSDDCLQSSGINTAINEVIYQCGGFDVAAIGTSSATVSFSVALAAADTAKVTAFEKGTTAADFEYHPAGDTATYLEFTSSDAHVVTQNVTTSPNGIILMDITMRLNQLTFGAAA